MIDFTTPSARRAELIGASIVIALALGFLLWYMATHEAPKPYEPFEAPLAPEEVPAAPKVHEEHGQYFDIEATYPGETPLKATLGEEADAKALAAMEDFVEETIAEFKKQGKFDTLTPEDIQMLGLSDTRKESLYIEYQEAAGAHTVSYVFTLSVDTLGAHPNSFYRIFAFSLEDGKELAIGDLFAPRSEHLKRLSAIAEFELTKVLGEFADVDYIRQGVAPEAQNFATFAIEGADLILLFPPYQVAPYAAGTQEVSIPLSDLADVLKPEYQAP